uniref:Pyrroline-5-carboxylate reductase n=1 Tax=Araucaria cunninghamii TaxID=56994 RepID=A0A0D6R8D3_ARACU
MMAESWRVGFIGAGKMAEAIARGLDKSGVLSSSRMRTAHLRLPRRQAFSSFGVTVCDSNAKVVEECEVLVLGVKPHVVKEVLVDLKPLLSKDKLLISIAAGVKLKDLEEWAGNARVVRVMPNTPCLVGETAAVMSLGSKATAEDEKLVKGLFEAVGQIWTANEKLLDAVTGLSGSGPAYIYLAIEAMADGGVAAGLPRDLALALASQTVLGAAKMVMDTKKNPGQLKDEVTSPAGTTIAGIHELEKGGLRASFMSAVIAAAKRSEELSKR